MILIDFDLHFISGISVIRAGNFTDSYNGSGEKKSDFNLAIASQSGELKICRINDKNDELEVIREFDLTENGGIWAMEAADVNHDGLDEIIVGGMNGAILCLSGDGNEVWEYDKITHQCTSGVSGIRVWDGAPVENPEINNSPIIVTFSLDRTIRVFDNRGKLIWSQMFSAGVGCIDFGDTNSDGNEELIAGGNDGTLRVFNGTSGKIMWFIENLGNIRDVLFLYGYIICGGDGRRVVVIDGKTQKIIFQREFPTYVWLIDRLNLDVVISTYSFNYIGMEDPTAGEPSIGVYEIPSLKERWSRSGINCQDISILPKKKMIIAADTSGKLILLPASSDFNNRIKSENIEIGSLINTICPMNLGEKSEVHTDELILYLGCDDKKVYKLVINCKEKFSD